MVVKITTNNKKKYLFILVRNLIEYWSAFAWTQERLYIQGSQQVILHSDMNNNLVSTIRLHGAVNLTLFLLVGSDEHMENNWFVDHQLGKGHFHLIYSI